MRAFYCLFLCSPRMGAVCFNSFSIFSLITYIICSDMHSQQLKCAVIMTSCGSVKPQDCRVVPRPLDGSVGPWLWLSYQLKPRFHPPSSSPQAFGSELQPLISSGLGCC